ncbi:MAG TPA: beta-N-acetylhexosaminidase [Thermoanaerobaculia bacterium]|nr:beta-N-acetylhexosaminidase [Thermoanaerobaculia bacterium]
MHNDTLGIGLTGKSLTDLERKIVTETSPYAVILFGRNVGDAGQLRELVREVKSIARRPPLFMIDEEGGRVDRLRHLIPGLPSAEAFGEGEQPAELSRWLGKVIGMALRWFDIEVDLAPVVDIRGEASPKGLERRTFGRDPETVIDLAGAFMDGLQRAGTAACLKHFPGIGIGSADPHYGATVIDVSLEELRNRDLVPFAALGNKAGAIMIGHGSYPQIENRELPATLSRRITTDLLREVAGFDGLAITDDMEMHAVSDFGSYESISERALLAGNDVVMFCSHIERVPDIQNFLASKMKSDDAFRRRVQDASGRAATYRQHIDYLRRDASPSAARFEDLIDEAARFVEAFEAARPEHEVVVPDVDRRKNSRTPGTGRTGREEWT